MRCAIAATCRDEYGSCKAAAHEVAHRSLPGSLAAAGLTLSQQASSAMLHRMLSVLCNFADDAVGEHTGMIKRLVWVEERGWDEDS